MISKEELGLAEKCLELSMKEGATHCRVTINKSTSDLLDTLNGEVDKVTHCLDRSLSLSLFIDGKFASFSTNRLDEKELAGFVHTSAEITRVLETDDCRALPAPDRCCKDALSGTEMELYDPEYEQMDSERRKGLALAHCLDLAMPHEGFRIISEEGQYSDSEFDSITIDSNGLFCRHAETSFEYASEVTIEAEDGSKYSNYWWTSSPKLKDFDFDRIGQTALEKAVEQIGSRSTHSGKRTMVVRREMAPRLVTPLLNALGGYSLQQDNSFLMDSLGKEVFSPMLNIVDEPHRKGESGSRLFDSEGVATRTLPIIENGKVKTYFINTYIANKMGLAPTIEDATRPHLLASEGGLDEKAILEKCGEGILVTGFNGGNCNSATGDFSYGVEGFEFKDGKIGRPVNEILITGNFVDLWSHLKYAGDDVRKDMSKLIPTLAFDDVDFSGE